LMVRLIDRLMRHSDENCFRYDPPQRCILDGTASGANMEDASVYKGQHAKADR
jgi:hypothetical protein